MAADGWKPLTRRIIYFTFRFTPAGRVRDAKFQP
jgi:hypothetical protein